jgi:hypothetical protein
MPFDSTFAADSIPPDAPREMTICFARTDAGDAELRRPGIALTLPARQLLFSIEKGIAIDACIAVVTGSSLVDAMVLLRRGLVRIDAVHASGADRVDVRRLEQVVHAMLRLPADELYTLLTQHAKLRLGLLHGFRMILALERCSRDEDQRALALRFVEDIWRAHGEAGVRPLTGAVRSAVT